MGRLSDTPAFRRAGREVVFEGRQMTVTAERFVRAGGEVF